MRFPPDARHLLPIAVALFACYCGALADDTSTVPSSPAGYVGTNAGQLREDNGLKTKLVWIPPGRFTMGSPKNEKGRGDDENQVQVTLTEGFWIGQHEVTQGEWQRVMGTTPWKGRGYGLKFADQYPAIYVSWGDATKFCAKLTKTEHNAGRLPPDWKYALPTEAQWEYACRAGTTTQYSFGNDETELKQYACFDKTASSTKERYPHLVGTKRPNPWGVYDMHGNVIEWCRDRYVKDLPGGENPEVTAKVPLRVARGGNWVITSRFCRAAHRDWSEPDEKTNSIGFRLAAVPVIR
jgi:sulfatase modifying factor 1